MKIFFYGIWNDLKRNKFFNILMFIEVLALLFLFAILLGFTENEAKILNYYDSKNGEAAIVSMSSEAKMADFVGKEGFQHLGLSKKKQFEFESKHGYEITKVVFINSKLAD